ncbi:hypothetical protein [Rhodococcus rhodochrous]|uniref:hypothetical protein n=1 Tax=Rhodococcus rhodochrous TaxID=1829 RepID=UPI0002FCD557|nr:hypothetical protein [Rhodococcus rhodochrous]
MTSTPDRTSSGYATQKPHYHNGLRRQHRYGQLRRLGGHLPRYNIIDRSTGLSATFRMNSAKTGTKFLTELGSNS